jgi:hypothetical protein
LRCEKEAARSETPSLQSYTLRCDSFTEVDRVCRVALREPMHLCTCMSEEGSTGNTVIFIYIARQVIRQSIMHLFPVTGVPPRIYYPDRGPPPVDIDFFCDSWVFLMKKWLATAKPGNRGESLRALQEVSKERITSVTDQYFTNLWRVGESQGRDAPSIE